jgi:RNA polymerase sigma-70 factor (ECF subfamily)
VQDVFYNLWKNRETLRIYRSWQGYLYRAVFNNAMMYLRKARREQPMDESHHRLLEFPTEDMSDQMELEEVAGLMLRTLEELPERTREIFRLNREDGMKYREIAEMLSISVKTVEAHMGRALRALRTTLQKYEQE